MQKLQTAIAVQSSKQQDTQPSEFWADHKTIKFTQGHQAASKANTKIPLYSKADLISPKSLWCSSNTEILSKLLRVVWTGKGKWALPAYNIWHITFTVLEKVTTLKVFDMPNGHCWPSSLKHWWLYSPFFLCESTWGKCWRFHNNSFIQ